MLVYAVKLTRRPRDVSAEDVDGLRTVGFDDAAILDICQVVAYYNYVNRLADGLGVELEDFWTEDDLTIDRAEFEAQVERVIADEESLVVNVVGVGDIADAAVVVEFQVLVAQEAAAGDHTKADIGLGQRRQDIFSFDAAVALGNDSKAERRTLAVLTLDQVARVVGEQRLKQRQIFTPPLGHRRQLGQLYEADGGVDFLRSDVVAGQDELVGIVEISTGFFE